VLHRIAIIALGLSVTAVSFSAGSPRLKDDDVKKLMEEVKKDVERFTDAVDSKYRTAKIRTATSEVAIDGYLKDLKNRAEAMRDRFKEDYAASREVLSFLQQASAIEKRSAGKETLFGAEKEWPRLRGTLGRLSQVYGVDGNASPESWTARRMNDRELVEAIETYAKFAESLKKSLEEALKYVGDVGKEERKAVMAAVDRLPDVADDLKGAVEDGKDAAGELGLLKSASDEIEKFLSKHGLTNAVGSTFRTLAAQHAAIAAAFH